ncbi:MAG: N-acetylmuramoyl-L-alanine amidase [Fibrobacter sp.]|nr:N-acetylmuramoyl-L-alanine amidase [Fibrobacter sp.]
MKIINCLLDKNNALDINGMSLGKLIEQSGKEFLWSDRECDTIDVIVVHYISAVDVTPADPYNVKTIMKIFCDFSVSSHFLIDRGGVIYRLVPENMKAWHCGGSRMPHPDNRTAVNNFSIGIELMATAISGFTSIQYDSLAKLALLIENKYQRKFKLVGHDMVANEAVVNEGLRKDIKVDPGQYFSWSSLLKRISSLREANVCNSFE